MAARRTARPFTLIVPAKVRSCGGHHVVSVACAEDKLLPALRGLTSDTMVIADGFSCRTQIRDLAENRAPRHTASVLADAVRSTRGLS